VATTVCYQSGGEVTGFVVIGGEIYAAQACSRREIVRAWRDSGGSVSALIGNLAHPGKRLVYVGDEPPTPLRASRAARGHRCRAPVLRLTRHCWTHFRNPEDASAPCA
jgi:hypothetical protein